MTMTDFAGYLASAMVLLTFLTKDMRLLRGLAILSNVSFITYGSLVWIAPVLCLHCLLLPVNTFRLRSLLIEQGCRLQVPSWSAITRLFRATPQGGSLNRA